MSWLSNTTFALFVLDVACPLLAQVNSGELRLRVTDPSGLGLNALVTVSNEPNKFLRTFVASEAGEVDIKALAYGVYLVRAEKSGFVPDVETVEVRSALPAQRAVRLTIAPAGASIQVYSSAPLIDLNRPSSIIQIGSKQIGERIGSLPGRSVQDLVNSQPGWLYEGNAVLHPRGSEYQTQFVVDGIPLTDNRSPGLGPEIEADNLDSVSIYTAGFPAEYGRKMGGVVELNTRIETGDGLHGHVVLSGGSYGTGSSFAEMQEVKGKNSFGASATGSLSAHYLNPVVPNNYTNRGTTADFSINFERELTQNDRLSLTARHVLSRFEIPNELIQERAGQLQTADNFETIGTIRYQHVYSPNGLIAFAGMVRDNANDLNSNHDSTPIVATQHNGFREGYFKSTYSLRHGAQEFRGGIETDTAFLSENFSYSITDPTRFDAGTPSSPPPFVASGLDIEPSAFIEDLVHLGKWTVRVGLRWDHYQLLLNQSAFSPRISIGRSLPSLNMALHASLDRVFQTPSFENLLITSSQWIDQINPSVFHLPVRPSKGTYYEGGLTQAFRQRTSVDIDVYRRDVRNSADDDQLLNTGITYPIAFDKSVIYGAEAKLSLVRLGKLSGYASYSYMVGNAWFPVSGGLFLGDSAVATLNQTVGHFPDSQDQRNTLRARFHYQAATRIWFACGASYGSGLPFAYDGDRATALAEYGPAVISRINFARRRTLPLLAVNGSFGADLHRGDRVATRIQIDGDNLNGRLNILDFGGLFSGNAIAPGRIFSMRLSTSF